MTHAKWVRYTQQIMPDSVKSQLWEMACILPPKVLLTILVQIEAEVALEQRPSVLTPEAQGADLGESYGLQAGRSSLGLL